MIAKIVYAVALIWLALISWVWANKAANDMIPEEEGKDA